jgi:hypothetical protein
MWKMTKKDEVKKNEFYKIVETVGGKRDDIQVLMMAEQQKTMSSWDKLKSVSLMTSLNTHHGGFNKSDSVLKDSESEVGEEVLKNIR